MLSYCPINRKHDAIIIICLVGATKDTEERLLSNEAQAILRSLAEVCVTDIAQVEARHASNRELAHMQNRGWFPSLPTLAAKFVCTTLGHLRKMVRAVSPMFDQHFESQPEQHALDGAGTKTQTGGHAHDRKKLKPGQTAAKKRTAGGAWRAFCHQMCGGEKFSAQTMAKLGEQFRALTPEQKEQYAIAGRAATLAAQHGFSAFGQAPRKKAADKFSVHEKLVERLSDFPAPGTQLPSGAIVAANSDWDLQLASMRYGPDSFDEQYNKVKDLANMERKTRLQETELTKERLLELQEFAGCASADPFVQNLMGKNMTETGTGFLLSGQRANFVSFDWIAPISKAVKARLAWFCQLTSHGPKDSRLRL